MSNYFLNIAFKTQGLTSTQKFVFVAMADAAGDFGECYPSIEHIVGKTSLDRKTIIAAIGHLEEKGHLVATGEKKGRTKSIRVLRIVENPQANSTSAENGTANERATADGAQPTEKTHHIDAVDKHISSSTKNGTVPDFPASSPVLPTEAVPFLPGSSPKNGTQTPYNPSIDPSMTQRAREDVVSGDKGGDAAGPCDAELAAGVVIVFKGAQAASDRLWGPDAKTIPRTEPAKLLVADWLRAGIAADECVRIIAGTMARVREAGKDSPFSIKFFTVAVQRGIAALPQPGAPAVLPTLPPAAEVALKKSTMRQQDIDQWIRPCEFDFHQRRLVAKTSYAAEQIENRFGTMIRHVLPGFTVVAKRDVHDNAAA